MTTRDKLKMGHNKHISLERALGTLREWRRARREVRELLDQWRASIRAASRGPAHEPVRRAVIVPGDPWTLIGSKGDEAMMIAAAQTLFPAGGGAVGIVTGTDEADVAAKTLGFEALRVWTHPWQLASVWNVIAAFRADALLVIGADVMDGYYNPATSIKLLALADLAACNGLHSVILGFSFNRNPDRRVVGVFDRLNERVRVNVRDGLSLKRLNSVSSVRAWLVADAAFLLEPDNESLRLAELTDWIHNRRSAGDRVVGFNLHPMLLKDATSLDLTRLVGSAATALGRLVERNGSSVALLPHDYRERDGDDVCLGPLHSELIGRFPERIFYPTEHFNARELKAAAGLMDGVVTGRMHLAIASLGMGVPVAALTYQDKFQGLFDHFGIPHRFLLRPEEARKADRLADLVENFVEEMERLRELVHARLPEVVCASRGNFLGMIES
ncbi:MAG: polysaccharide pyruvyl transferase family protein [Opitutaceae bacterium]|nr:polysaccharide pyruvyl transferase family protein [Opitutaceae bacterium]